jgi:hypothetical protein
VLLIAVSCASQYDFDSLHCRAVARTADWPELPPLQTERRASAQSSSTFIQHSFCTIIPLQVWLRAWPVKTFFARPLPREPKKEEVAEDVSTSCTQSLRQRLAVRSHCASGAAACTHMIAGGQAKCHAVERSRLRR